MAGLRSVRRVARTVLLLACACAVAAVMLAGPENGPAGLGAAQAAAQESAPAAPAAQAGAAALPRRLPALARAAAPPQAARGAQPAGCADRRGPRRRGGGDGADQARAAPVDPPDAAALGALAAPRSRGAAPSPSRLKVSRQVPSWGRAHLRSIAWCESKNDPRAIGGGGAYRGMYQFSFSTWAVVGGSGDPAAASRASRPGAPGCCSAGTAAGTGRSAAEAAPDDGPRRCVRCTSAAASALR